MNFHFYRKSFNNAPSNSLILKLDPLKSIKGLVPQTQPRQDHRNSNNKLRLSFSKKYIFTKYIDLANQS